MEKGDKIQCLDHGFVQYVDHAGSDQFICEAARVSYGSTSKGPENDRKLLHYLYKNKHTSPFEMVKLYLVIHMPIFVARQYIRHRMQNVNEVSARYTELPDQFYCPGEWRYQDPKNKQGSTGSFDPAVSTDFGMKAASDVVRNHSRQAYELYQELIAVGVAREMARMVLPLNIYTTMRVCWDLKNLLHFITLREDAHAQAEIQEYGRAIKTICTVLFPLTMEAYDLYKFPCTESGLPTSLATPKELR